jgi:putative membrane protein
MTKVEALLWVPAAVLLTSCYRDNQYGPMYGPGGGWPMMHYWFGGWFMWLIPVIVIIIAFYLILQAQKGKATRETPLEILKKRYAKGELTKEQFDQMKRDLTE